MRVVHAMLTRGSVFSSLSDLSTSSAETEHENSV